MTNWRFSCVCFLVLLSAYLTRPSDALAGPWRPTIQASVDRTTLTLGESALVTYACGGGATGCRRDVTHWARIFGQSDGEEIPLVGSYQITPTKAGTETHNIVAYRRRFDLNHSHGPDGTRRTVVRSFTLTVNETPQPPVPPDPPIPPTPIKGFNVLLVAPEPRALRTLTPDQVAIFTSRIVRDFVEASCEKDEMGLPAYRAVARSAGAGLLARRWQDLLAKAPADGFSLVAVNGDRSFIGPLPADTAATLKILQEVAGVKAKPSAFTPVKLREPTPEQWKAWTSKTGQVIVNGQVRFLSLKPRDLKKHPYGTAPGTVSLKAAGINLIPRSEWPARIAALKAAKAGVRNLAYGKVPCSDQAQTNYCWANCVAGSIGLVSYEQGQAAVYFSAASLGGPITGYRNEGGWPADAVAFAQATGCVKDSLWPNAAINRAYFNKPEVQADYPKHRIVGTLLDLGASGKMFDECATVVLLGGTIAVSYDFWSHAIVMCGIDVDDQGRYYAELRNSWGADWPTDGAEGFFAMREGSGQNRGTPDDAQGVLYVVAQ